MLSTYLLPISALLSAVLAGPVLPPINSRQENTNTTLTPRGDTGPLGSYYRLNVGCFYHTNVRQQCEGGKLNTYVWISRFVDDKGTFSYFDGKPTIGITGIRYLPGVTQVGPKLWKNYNGRFESTWYGDHMWYSYHGPSWSDNDQDACQKGAWTAGPLECGKPGTLNWRTYDADCAFKCIW